ncbi:MFS transporter [Amycolatopsis australiensis]|uniref:MFS transporter, DHA2 family, multidrug resistance protein n=1 Tax=Amycolatopsis australiensis TaxID=546364 RepID=A0A1K1T2Q4_9PSEU|nr:MFS transporter [Amycolatopsis australiensis]SFW90782.1 MFS transporter, DHA2 family, multidrug resistance protein [Amycolatopsis australiensis]
MDKPAGRREWLGLTVLVLPTLLVAMDMTSLFLALPQLSADLGASATEQLWITDSYGFVVAGFVITMGTLGDRIGRRRLLLAGGGTFAAVSAVAAFSTSPEMLIVARGALGIAGATLMPSTLALITNMFRDGRQRGKAIAIWATCQFAGGAAGPVLAGLLLQHFAWGSVFLVAVPAMGVLLAAGPFLLPEFRAPSSGRLDFAGVGLSLAAVLLIVFGLKQLSTGELLVPLAAIAAGTVLGTAFARRQLTRPEPLLDLRLFRNRPFTAVLVALVFAGVAMAGVGLLVTQYLQSVLGYSPLASAVLFAPMGLGVAAGTMTAPALTRRTTPATAIAGGLAVSAAGGLLLAGTGGLAAVMVGIAVLALGTGPLFALGIGLVVGAVPPERAGSAASMADTGNYLGGSLGMALIGLTATAVYHGVFPAGTTLAADVTRAEVAEQAKDAFTMAVHVTGLIAAVLFAGLAVLVRAMRPASAPAPEPAMAK